VTQSERDPGGLSVLKKIFLSREPVLRGGVLVVAGVFAVYDLVAAAASASNAAGLCNMAGPGLITRQMPASPMNGLTHTRAHL